MERRVVRGVVRVGAGEDIVGRVVMVWRGRRRRVGMGKGDILFAVDE